ncbi:hypothetical protein A4E84_35435 [Streptomyces qaidamensis]|uniref:Tat pathway signal sequence domain protein n=1 Tax=Streptomyces qaidamensis TaxID=1783515 RepID=A0A143CBJ9_9ACTN|nr:hypothetical protein [Streptomyces qaidamensis]AMW14325.1 hypothetical protein A4E84_35435 [Streptomyces qaidamensis]
MNAKFSRRSVLKQFTGVVAGAALLTTGEGLLAPLTAQAADDSWHKSRSANGWNVLPGRSPGTAPYDIPGTTLRVTLREGDVGTVLSYVAQRFHYDVAELEAGRGQIIGYSDALHVKADFESNHLSGTALALYPESYPLGVKGNLFPYQVTAIRDILAELQGVIKWGGDMEPAKESTFFVDVPPGSAELAQVAQTLRQWRITPGKGAGTQNVQDPKRITAAKKLASKQAA